MRLHTQMCRRPYSCYIYVHDMHMHMYKYAYAPDTPMCTHTHVHAQVILDQSGGWMTSRDNNCIRESIDWFIARLAGSGGLEQLWEKWWAAPLSCMSEEDAVA